MKKKIVYLVNHVAFFVSHRLPLAIHAKKNGYQVVLVTGLAGSNSMETEAQKLLKKYDIEHIRVRMSVSSFNILTEFIGVLELTYNLIRIKPSIIHAVSTKGIIYGGILARLLRIKSLVISYAGMGYLFTGNTDSKLKVFQFIFILLQKFILKHKNLRVIIQNNDDKKFLINHNIVKKKYIVFIKGSGVNLKKFAFSPIKQAEKIVLFPSRLLRNKGVIEFLEASKILSKKYPDWRFVLAGSIDYVHPTSISLEDINNFIKIKNIEWVGHQTNILKLYKKSSIVCLPSYREGMPKSLIEAAAVGRPVVTTNAVGCKESVLNKKTGIIVPTKNIDKLAQGIETLIRNKKLRYKYGKDARIFAEKSFDLEDVKDKVQDIYNLLLKV
jgi:glycosyltransferase involved in cell wall biosynthesis